MTPELSDDVLEEMLLRAGPEVAAPFRLVNKRWLSRFSDVDFRRNLYLRGQKEGRTKLFVISWPSIYTLSYIGGSVSDVWKTGVSSRGLEIVGSCRGLICLRYCRDCFFVLNPCTKEFRKLPDPGVFFRDGETVDFYGFGYDSVNADFKIVMIAVKQFDSKCQKSVAKVLSLKTNSWKQVEDDFPIRIVYQVPVQDSGVYWNGALHWPARDFSYSYSVLVSFHLTEQKFGLVPLPNSHSRMENRIICAGASEGCLLFVCVGEGDYAELWKMQGCKPHGSWTKLMTFPRIYDDQANLIYVMSLLHVKDDLLLMRVNQLHIVWYTHHNTGNGRFNEFSIPGDDPKGFIEATSYEETAISPFAFGGHGTGGHLYPAKVEEGKSM